MPRMKFVSLCVAPVVALITGCTVGPDFHRPDAPRANGYTSETAALHTAAANVLGGEAQRFVQGMDLPGQWWSLFHSAELDRLIDRSLNANPNVQAAEAAVRGAMENVYAQRGFFYPTVQTSFSPSRQKNPVGTLSPALTSGEPIFNLYTAQVSVGYVPDVFGGNRRQVESLLAQAEFQRFQLEAAYLTLTSNVVVAAIQEASLRAQIAATERVIGIETEQVEISRRQYALGAIAMGDVVAQEAVLAQTRATLPILKKQLAIQRNLLTALAGCFPSDELTEQFELSTLQLPQDLPLTVPSQLVQQRPDIRAAEAQLHAASAQIGVATANMLPQMTLSAAIGGTATQIGDMLAANNVFWSIAGSAAQTIFAGGTLLHRKRAATAAYDQASAQYRSTVITAFQNVADSLRALQYDADALNAQVAAEHAAAESLEIARRALQLGSISYLALLNVEQTYQQAVINLVQSRVNRYTDTAALFQSLGGGWWNRSKGPLNPAPEGSSN